MTEKELLEQGFASEAELDGFMKRVERDLMDLDDNDPEFVCGCHDCAMHAELKRRRALKGAGEC